MLTTKTIMDDEARAWLISRIDLAGKSNWPCVKSKMYLAMKKQNKKKALKHPSEIRVSMSIMPDEK